MKRPLLTEDRVGDLDNKIFNGAFHSNPWKHNVHKYRDSRFLRRVITVISEDQKQKLSGATKRWFTSLLLRSNTRELYRKFVPNGGELYYIITDYLTIGSEDLDAKINYLRAADRA